MWTHAVFLILLASRTARAALTSVSASTGIDGVASPEIPSADSGKESRIFMAIVARNAGDTLPTYLELIERLDYPKDHIQVHMCVDSGRPGDTTVAILRAWAATHQSQRTYRAVSFSARSALAVDGAQNTTELGECEDKPHCFNDERQRDLIAARQDCLDAARRSGDDLLFSVDTDVFLTHPSTLRVLAAAVAQGADMVLCFFPSSYVYVIRMMSFNFKNS